jgi:RND family efflux transporter MFP subunit
LAKKILSSINNNGITMLNTEANPVVSLLSSSVDSLVDQLNNLGVACKGIAVLDGEGKILLGFSNTDSILDDALTQLTQRVAQERQLAIVRDGQTGYLVAYPFLGADQNVNHIVVTWLDSVSEQTLILVRLSMGWLQVPFLQVAANNSSQASYLLEMQAQVFSQEKSRAGAQEWVNRIAQLLRHSLDDVDCSVLYFRMREPGSVVPCWWVTSDTASAEKGTATLHAATDAAARAALEFRELQLGDLWVFPAMNEGEIVGAMVIAGPINDLRLKAAVRASASVIGALLVHWYASERGLWSHAVASLRAGIRKLYEPGFFTWKAGAISLLLTLGILLLIPFDDHAVAKVVVEGQKQHVISAPFEGYWAEVLVRPGDTVQEGQLMARLDTKDLKAEQEKLQSECDLASGKLRQAFADADSSSVQQASAQLRQANAQLTLVEYKLQRSELRAPADGAVIFGDWYDQIGSPVETGKKLFEIAAGSGYRVVLQVPEEEIARVSLEQVGEIRVTGLPQKQFEFHVNRVTAVAALDDRKNTFRVEARLSDPGAPLRPGMQGVGKIVVAQNNLISIWMRPVSQWLRMKLWTMWW